VAATAVLVRGALTGSSPPYVAFSFAVFDDAGNLVVGPDMGQAGTEVTAQSTPASLAEAAQESMRASLAQNFPQVDLTGLVVVTVP
jgi:hypothetical protein